MTPEYYSSIFIEVSKKKIERLPNRSTKRNKKTAFLGGKNIAKSAKKESTRAKA